MAAGLIRETLQDKQGGRQGNVTCGGWERCLLLPKKAEEKVLRLGHLLRKMLRNTRLVADACGIEVLEHVVIIKEGFYK